MKWIRVAGLVLLVVLAVAALEAVVAAHHPEDTPSLTEDSKVWIDPPQLSVDVGETFTVTVRVDNAQDMIGYEFEMIDWDSSVLTVTEVTDAGFLPGTPIEQGEISDGELTFSAFLSPPYEAGANGDFPLAVITLRAVRSGVSDLDLDGRKVKWFEWIGGSDWIEREPSGEGGVEDGRVTVGSGFTVYLPLTMRSYRP